MLVIGLIYDDIKQEPEFQKTKCSFLLSNGKCLANDKIAFFIPQGLSQECKSGYVESVELAIGRVCVQVDEDNMIPNPIYCSDETCYPIGLTINDGTNFDIDYFNREVSIIIKNVQVLELRSGIETASYGNCNFMIAYEKEYEEKNIWHDWKFSFVTWDECNSDVRTMILNAYSDLVDERLLILDPPITKTYTSFKLCNWNPECDSFYMELYNDGYRMIEFRTFANGLQQIALDGDEHDPTEKELCLEYNIDVTPDGSCRYQILNERIEALEKKLYSDMDSTLSEFNDGYDPTGLSKKQMDEISKQYNECDGSFLFVNNYDGTYYTNCLVDYGGASGKSGTVTIIPKDEIIDEAIKTALEEWSLDNFKVIYYKEIET